MVSSPYKGSPDLLCDESRCSRCPIIIKLRYYHNAEAQHCTLLKTTGYGIWRFSESIHDIESSNCKDLMWLETGTVVTTVIFGLADRITRALTVSGFATNWRVQLSRGPTSVIMSSHIISVIFSKALHRHHHLKSFWLVVIAGTHAIWLQHKNRLKHPNVSHYLHITSIQTFYKKWRIHSLSSPVYHVGVDTCHKWCITDCICSMYWL